MIQKVSYGYPFKPEMGCFGFSTALLIKDRELTVLFDTGGYNLRNELSPHVEDIDVVVISHLHFDHCSNIDLFIKSKTPIIISKKEIEYYENHKQVDNDLFSYFDYIKNDLNIQLIDANHKISDKLTIISTPGHTPGHISLEIANDTENVIVAGDALKTFEDYNNPEEYGNAFDKKEYLSTKSKLKKKYNIIYLGHDNMISNGKRGKIMEVYEF